MKKTRLIFILLSLSTISYRGILGEVCEPVFSLSLIFVTILLVTSILGRKKFLYCSRQSVFILPVISIVVFLILPVEYIYIRLLLLVIFCFFMGKILQPLDKESSALLWVAGISTFMFVIFLWLYNIEPFIWTALQIISHKTSLLLGGLTNQNILLSVTASGFTTTVLFVLFGISAVIITPRSINCIIIYCNGSSENGLFEKIFW